MKKKPKNERSTSEISTWNPCIDPIKLPKNFDITMIIKKAANPYKPDAAGLSK